MYVAMTRAREELYISRAGERFHFWDYVRNPPSRFISEIPNEFIENYVSSSIAENRNFFWSSNNNIWSHTWWFSWPKITKPIVNNDVSSFSIWDRVNHHKFWNGIITSLKWEIAEIAFSGKIIKMSLKIAPLKKV
jgi:DNA helicase-2/ATP-dependent DNA helicase PcrA